MLAGEIYDQVKKTLAEHRKFLEENFARDRARLDAIEQRLQSPHPAAGGGTKSIVTPGDHVAKSRLVELVKSTGRGIVQLDCSFHAPMESKAITISGVGRATTGVVPLERLPGIVPGPRRRLTIADLIRRRPIDAGAVDFVRENVFTNNASPQEEGQAKAESSLTFTAVSSIVRTIAHWMAASRQVLDDFEGLRDFIDRTLVYGLRLREEQEILIGDGLGEHLNGICTQAASYAGTYAQAGDTKIDTLRHAILELQDQDETADFVVLNPRDWHDIELIKEEAGGTNKGRYILHDPITGALEAGRLWGLTVVVSRTMPAGKFLLGDSAQAMVFERLPVTVEASTEHADYFVKNLVAIRAEERIALVVYRPSAFLYGSF